jgi:pyrroloquinoline-quinone synthase
MMLRETIERVLAETPYRANPYFSNLQRKTFAKEDFTETQIQFYFAVVFFSRPMAALAAKIPEARLRVEVVRNVWEEHGEGDAARVHGHTFLTLLERLANISEEDVNRRALWPEVRIFNTTLVGACVLDEYLIGVAMMGIIERMFCEISTWVGRGIIDNGWVPREKMIHYNLHEELDIKHSQDFFDILEPAWSRSEEDRYAIEQGLQTGAVVFNGLYEGLWTGRKRRLLRDVLGPHSRA